ncbi:hypothetical protein D3C71_1789720 [compost metagenome]
MDHKVRVPANRRSEVGVELGSQTKVPGALGVILRLLHRAEHHRADDRLFLRALNVLQQGLQGTRVNRIALTLN